MTTTSINNSTAEDNNSSPEFKNTLQEFSDSLSDSDKELIKTIPLNNLDYVLGLDHEQFRDLIKGSLSLEELGKLSDEQLERRTILIEEIKRIRARLQIHKWDEEQGEQKAHKEQKKEEKRKETDNDEDKEELDLATRTRLSTEDITFVINTMKKEAQYDEISIKQLLYGMCSAFTKCPIPHNVNSKESGAGKSYLLTLVSAYFPDKYVMPISGMSDKAIYHRQGVMVIKKKEVDGQQESDDDDGVEPTTPILDNLELEKEELEEQIGRRGQYHNQHEDKEIVKEIKKRVKEIENEIKDIKENAEKLIDLSNQIILCLDTPQDSLFDTLMSLMSQDTPRDQIYSFTDKSGIGKLGTKNNRLRGMPVIFTTRVIDDTRTLRFQEKNRRFINVTPDTSNKKISAANNIIGLKYGSISEEYDTLVVSRHDKEKAKRILKILIAKLKQHSKHLQPKQSGVKIPFVDAITHSMPNDRVWSMTVTERIMKYLSIIAKVNMDNRPKIVEQETGQFYPIATFEDLKETLQLMERGASDIRPYITKWYNDVFDRAFQDCNGEPNAIVNEDGIIISKEKHVGVTTEQLAEKTKEVYGGPKPSGRDLLLRYIYPLINQGIIDKVKSELNGKQNILFPVEEGGTSLYSIFEDPDDPRLKVSEPPIFPSRTVIEDSYLLLSRQYYRESEVLKNKYKLLDSDGKTEITVKELADKYFNSPEECFIKDYVSNEACCLDYAIAGSDNVSCSQTMMRNSLNDNVHNDNCETESNNKKIPHPSCNNILTKIDNNVVEDSNSILPKANTTRVDRQQ